MNQYDLSNIISQMANENAMIGTIVGPPALKYTSTCSR
jgi:hypothetical protein